MSTTPQSSGQNPFTTIADDLALDRYVGDLRNRGVFEIAVDFEGEFNVHEYGERLCLVQVFDGENAVIIDPFAISAKRLKSFLEDRNILKIMYDSQGDQSLVRKQYGAKILSIQDLKPAVEILELEKQDLSAVLQSQLQVSVSGKRRFQMYNWTRRPIAPEPLQYALSDVLHLAELRDKLLAELIRRKQLTRYFLENLKVQNKPPGPDKEPGVLRSGRFFRLSKPQQQLFRSLYDERDELARDLNLPPNTVLPNSAMFSLAAGELDSRRLAPANRVPIDAFANLIERIERLVRQR